MTLLDVGCGYRPTGTVNVDKLRRPYEAEGDHRQICALDVQAVGEYLPFRSGSFESVYSNSVIEHSRDPRSFVLECLRVARYGVLIRCPHYDGSAARMKHHRHYFTEEWFKAQWPGSMIAIQRQPFIPEWILKSNRFVRWYFNRICPLIGLTRKYYLNVFITK